MGKSFWKPKRGGAPAVATTLRGVLRGALGDAERAEACVARLAALSDGVLRAPKEDCELLYGRCGYLHALLFARRRALHTHRRDELLPVSLFASVAAQVVREGLAKDRADARNDETGTGKTPRSPRLAHAWRGKRYLGFAHGSCGIVTTLLQCLETFGDAVFEACDDVNATKAALDETVSSLLASSFADGNLPSSASKKPSSSSRAPSDSTFETMSTLSPTG